MGHTSTGQIEVSDEIRVIARASVVREQNGLGLIRCIREISCVVHLECIEATSPQFAWHLKYICLDNERV